MLVYFAILLTALLGFSGLVVDVGRIELRSLQLQAAADSAALSAAAEYQRSSGNLTTATNAANSELATFASLNGVPAPSATVTLSATSGHFQNDGSTIQVKVTQPVSTTMLSLIKGGSSTLTAGATAVAMIPPCIYLMGHPSISSRGGNNLGLSSQGFHLTCPMYSSTGYFVDGFSNINSWQAKAAGPASQTYGGGWEYPAIIYNSPALADPLAYITAPVFSSCTYPSPNYNTDQHLTPGTYCGPFTASHVTLTLAPGLYIITGGASFDTVTMNGNGVTLFFTKEGGSTFGSFYSRYSTFNISAPTDNSAGGIPAILMMTDRSWVNGETDFYLFDSSLKGDGVIYLTGTGIGSWQTGMSGYNYFNFVVANLSFYNANLVFSCDYSGLPGGNPFRNVISLVQ